MALKRYLFQKLYALYFQEVIGTTYVCMITNCERQIGRAMFVCIDYGQTLCSYVCKNKYQLKYLGQNLRTYYIKIICILITNVNFMIYFFNTVDMESTK